MLQVRSRSVRVERFPLTLRLPNAPPAFVGRERESDALEAAIRRAPLSCVWGVGGLGKSALTFHVIHQRFPEHVSRTVMLRLARDESLDQALLTIARTLSDVQRVSGIDWRSLVTHRDALFAAALDLAEGAHAGVSAGRKKESQAFWVVIDDLHHADPVRAAEVLEQIARYARHSRWIVVGRTSLLPTEALGQAVALGPMTPEDLRALGQKWGMEQPIDGMIVAAAGGSPWRLGQLLRGVRPGLEPGMGDLLEGLPADVAAFLLDLSLIEAELSPEALASFTALPSAEALDALERRGLIERRPSGIRLHDVARGLVAERLDGPTRRERRLAVAHALRQCTPLTVWLEGLRLLVEEGEVTQAAEALEVRGAELIEAGLVFGVWNILERETAASLASFRLYCATEIGDTTKLRDLALPTSPTPLDRMRWAFSLFLQGKYDDAALAGTEAQQAALAVGDAAAAFDAARIVNRTYMARGHYARALEGFDAQVPATPRQALLRDTDIAAALTGLERRAQAFTLIQSAEARLDEQPELGDNALYYGVAWVLYHLGAVRLAERALERVAASIGGERVLGLASARYLMLSTGVSFDRGALSTAADLLEKLPLFTAHSPGDAMFVAIQRCNLRVLCGPFDELGRDIEQVIEDIGKIGREDLAHTACMIRHQAALALGEPPSTSHLDIEPNRTVWEDQHLLWEIVHRVHWGKDCRHPSVVRSEVPEVKVLVSICGAWFALAAAGDPDEARRMAANAATCAAEHGYGLLEILAYECEAVAVLLSSAPCAAVKESATRLARLARERGATALSVHGELLSLVASREDFVPARIEEIAVEANAPVAMRRARALLGETIMLDRVDEAVIAAVHARVGCRIVMVNQRTAKGVRGWGLDERTNSVWLVDRSCSFADRPLLWRILGVIADAGGAAEKEEIVLRAWGQREYHPLRDDARLHTAIRTLRRHIEDDPGHPSRLVTTRQGYAFGSDAPVRRAMAMASPA